MITKHRNPCEKRSEITIIDTNVSVSTLKYKRLRYTHFTMQRVGIVARQVDDRMLDEQYELLKSQMRELESVFNENKLSALYGMIDLYGKLRGTNYHDIADSIGLWVDHFPEAELLKYIAEKNDSYYDVLTGIIHSKQV